MRLTNIFFVSVFILSKFSFSQINSSSDSLIIGESIFAKVEIESFYPGGESAWRQFLEKNLNPNVPVNNGAPAGRYTVWVQFVVDKEGKTSEKKALTSLGYGMEKEVMELIKKSGKWNPAMQNKRYVKAYRKQPVTFVIEAGDFDIRSIVPYFLFTSIDNEITLTVNNVKGADLMLTISQGRIIPKGEGIYVVKVTKPGRVIISIFNTRKNKKIGNASFEVRENE
jgi:hypothetical protein